MRLPGVKFANSARSMKRESTLSILGNTDKGTSAGVGAVAAVMCGGMFLHSRVPSPDTGSNATTAATSKSPGYPPQLNLPRPPSTAQDPVVVPSAALR